MTLPGLPLIHSHYTPLLFLLWAVFVLLCRKYGKQGSIIQWHAGWNPPSAETNLKSPINRFRGSPSCVLPVYRAQSHGPLLRAVVVPESMKMNFYNVSSRSVCVLKVMWSWQSPRGRVPLMIKVRFLIADPTWHPVQSNDHLNLRRPASSFCSLQCVLVKRMCSSGVAFERPPVALSQIANAEERWERNKRGLGWFRDLHTLICAWPKPEANADLNLTTKSSNFKQLAMLTLKLKGFFG